MNAGTLVRLGAMAADYDASRVPEPTATAILHETTELVVRLDGAGWPVELATAAAEEWAAMLVAEALLAKDHPSRGSLHEAGAELRRLVTLPPGEVSLHRITGELIQREHANITTGLPWGPMAHD